MKIITIEEHLGGVPVSAHLGKYIEKHAPYTMLAHGKDLPYSPDERLWDLDKYRISDMDKNGITMQILSAPVQSQFFPKKDAGAIVADSNDYIIETGTPLHQFMRFKNFIMVGFRLWSVPDFPFTAGDGTMKPVCRLFVQFYREPLSSSRIYS